MPLDRDRRDDWMSDDLAFPGGAAGKRALTEGLPVQRKAEHTAAPASLPWTAPRGGEDPYAVHTLDERAEVQRKIGRPIQLKAASASASASTESGATGAETSPVTEEPAREPRKDKQGDPTVAKLHYLVDVDVKSLGLKDLKEGRVGHTWISIEYDDPHAVPDTVPASHKALLQNGGKYADPMGFWPDIQNNVYYNPNPFKSWVQGWMRHPDRAHEGAEKAVQTWAITQKQVDAVLDYAESKRGAQYSVYFFNCTTFGAEAVKAAGKSPPSSSTAGICFPNAAYQGIMDRQKKGVGDTWSKDLDTDEETSVQGPDTKKG